MIRIETVLLIDGGLIFRNFFAMPPMTDPAGRPVGAVFGFISMTLREIEAVRPSHVAVAFDVPVAENRRVQRFPSYKANRPECPPELAPQFDILREVLSSLNIPCLQAPGYEADDLLGSMARKAEEAGKQVSLLTGDRDVLQLLSGKTQVRYVKKLQAPETYDVPRFVQEFELLPSQLPDLKGLAGDPSDNLPGIQGVGPKTAVKLLQEYETVEGVLENAHRQKGKLRERLEQGREMALLCKQLATIEREVPGLPDLEGCRLNIDRSAGQAKFEALRFRSLLSKLAV
jgi:DNA polymerase-1